MDRHDNQRSSFVELVEKASLLIAERFSGSSESRLCEFVKDPETARAFFVAFLTAESVPTESELAKIRSLVVVRDELLVPVLVKNLVMSSTMVLTHSRNGDFSGADQSRRVAFLCRDLIESLPKELVEPRVEAMKQAIADRRSEIQTGRKAEDRSDLCAFLERWRYDQEQLEEAAGYL
ncbi:MAG: hypothetical protein IPM23_24230 [Candidatus Melainabacteria bacterium]|nr:hypothetical protein [Candidatus Melainabacteria bacterium]